MVNGQPIAHFSPLGKEIISKLTAFQELGSSQNNRGIKALHVLTIFLAWLYHTFNPMRYCSFYKGCKNNNNKKASTAVPQLFCPRNTSGLMMNDNVILVGMLI